ncbi:hypothetical protein [Pseudoduganella chitinolytica]|uniref:HIT family protein n=1 Tax=Pseudoduganella chitinolytica TaxID=34070 RepID=A0ABY8B8T7_9BURK|nr:hypothetical protein [Pseudoduganella chitinolytica]WEF31401.1 hypothetical protein PX653_18280 [Pseudoduganella chitinolytica]
MNATLQRFGYPASVVRKYQHWSVLIRPAQITPFCCVIAAHAPVLSLGALPPAAGAEFPAVVRAFEATVRRLAPAMKFNYLALMMVDPNPHFHAIPRYAVPFTLGDASFSDTAYPKPVNPLADLAVGPATLEQWRTLLADHWIDPA